jgi:uncharacterized protein (TIGR02145 family)
MKKHVGFLEGPRVTAAAFILAALMAFFSSCEKNELVSYGNDFTGLTSDLSFAEIKDGRVTWFGPEKFKAGNRGPVVYTRSLEREGFNNYEDFVLVVQNANSNKLRVTKLEILIDGVGVITFSDFRRNPITIRKLTNLTASSVMKVKIYGSHGRFVTIRIECSPKSSSLTDIDGNTYKTVVIGDQLWMAENLRTTRFTDGTPISNVTGSVDWTNTVNLNSEAAFSWYNNDISNKQLYGALYNTHAVSMGINNDYTSQLCPAGWHIPTSADWYKLVLTLDPGAEQGANPMSETAGGKLKEAGLAHWASPNTGATNETGFTALPGGFRDEDGTFKGMGQSAYFWGDRGNSARYLGYDHTYVMFKETNNAFGYSVRCVKD